MAYKIALSAGHGRNTYGKRCDKKIDPNETREWVLNSRIAEKVETLLTEKYDGFELLRVDDRTGAKDIALKQRAKAANNFKADIYIAIHHNAGVKRGYGGGIVVYIQSKPTWDEVEFQDEIYGSLIAHTGLKGNRATPKNRANFTECTAPKMTAALLELGFMDSRTDVPIILTEDYARECAAAIVEVLVARGKLTEKGKTPEKIPEETTAEKLASMVNDYAEEKTAALKGKYMVDSPDGILNLRTGAGTDKAIIEIMCNGDIVRCYGWHTGKWLLVTSPAGTNAGFCHSDYLDRVNE